MAAFLLRSLYNKKILKRQHTVWVIYTFLKSPLQASARCVFFPTSSNQGCLLVDQMTKKLRVQRNYYGVLAACGRRSINWDEVEYLWNEICRQGACSGRMEKFLGDFKRTWFCLFCVMWGEEQVIRYNGNVVICF